jgi:D-alanine--poly(phosphoribitol) ligase subunit 2
MWLGSECAVGRSSIVTLTTHRTEPGFPRAIFATSSDPEAQSTFPLVAAGSIVPGAIRAMLRLSVSDQVLSALESVTRTGEVRRNVDLELFELDLLDSLGVVELLVLLSDRLGVDLSPAEFDRDAWATPRKIAAYVEGRLGP